MDTEKLESFDLAEIAGESRRRAEEMDEVINFYRTLFHFRILESVIVIVICVVAFLTLVFVIPSRLIGELPSMLTQLGLGGAALYKCLIFSEWYIHQEKDRKMVDMRDQLLILADEPARYTELWFKELAQKAKRLHESCFGG